jgi:hypothetical protein
VLLVFVFVELPGSYKRAKRLSEEEMCGAREVLRREIGDKCFP